MFQVVAVRFQRQLANFIHRTIPMSIHQTHIAYTQLKYRMERHAFVFWPIQWTFMTMYQSLMVQFNQELVYKGKFNHVFDTKTYLCISVIRCFIVNLPALVVRRTYFYFNPAYRLQPCFRFAYWILSPNPF